MLKSITVIFQRKQKFIKDEVALKSKVDEVVTKFVEEEILKKTKLDYQLSYMVNKGVIKVETNNKLIAQEIALRIRGLEERLRSEGVIFRKLLI